MDPTTVLIILLSAPFWLPALAIMLVLVGFVLIVVAAALLLVNNWAWRVLLGVPR